MFFLLDNTVLQFLMYNFKFIGPQLQFRIYLQGIFLFFRGADNQTLYFKKGELAFENKRFCQREAFSVTV